VLQDLVQGINFAVHGVSATVTRPWPDEAPIVTKGIWLTAGLTRPVTDPYPRDMALQRRERERVIAISLTDVPTIPTGTRIDAPEVAGGAIRAWRVDSLEYEDAIHRRVFVVPETEP
jgi:hypothetical protein